MKNICILFIITILLVPGCKGKKDETEATAARGPKDLAMELAKILPELDPEKGRVLASWESVELTAFEVIQAIHKNIGERAFELSSLDPNTLKQILFRNTQTLGEKKLLLIEAEKAGIKLDSKELDQALEEEFAQAGGKESFMESLKEQGILFKNVKTNIKSNLIIQRFVEKNLGDMISVPEEDIRGAYENRETASVRHILLMTQDKSEEEKVEIRKKMEAILTRAKQDEDFAELTREFTEDPGYKENGGLYEDFGRSVMVKPFEDAAFSVPVGEVSDIVETRYGYHILKIIDRKKDPRSYEEMRDELEKQLNRTASIRASQEYVRTLKMEKGFQLHVF